MSSSGEPTAGEPWSLSAVAIAPILDEIRSVALRVAEGDGGSADLKTEMISALRRLVEQAGLQAVIFDPRDAGAAGKPSEVALAEIAVLAAHEAGARGATPASIRQRVRWLLGQEVELAVIRAVVARLARQGRLVDRETRVFTPAVAAVPPSRTASGRPAVPIKTLILEAIEAGPAAGMRPVEIRTAIETLHGTRFELSIINPVLAQLRRAGRVTHAGRLWALA